MLNTLRRLVTPNGTEGKKMSYAVAGMAGNGQRAKDRGVQGGLRSELWNTLQTERDRMSERVRDGVQQQNLQGQVD